MIYIKLNNLSETIYLFLEKIKYNINKILPKVTVQLYTLYRNMYVNNYTLVIPKVQLRLHSTTSKTSSYTHQKSNIPTKTNRIFLTSNIISNPDYYPFGMGMGGRSGNNGNYRYGYQGSEKDDEIKGEGNYYTTFFRGLDPRLGKWLSVDPKVSSLPWQSPYCSMDNNPICFNDPFGDVIDSTASGYEDAKRRATPIYKKNGEINMRKSLRNGYEPEFAKIYNDFKDNQDIVVKFEHIGDESAEGGTISFDGENDKGQKIYSAKWNPNLTERLGASGVFEETYHLKEALEGKEMAFPDKPNSGVIGVDIYDEVRAKKWVINNIRSVKETYKIGGDYYGYTHYGYIKVKLVSDEKIKNTLMNVNGAPSLSPIFKGVPSSGGTMGGSYYKPYIPSNFGGGYTTLSPTPQYP